MLRSATRRVVIVYLYVGHVASIYYQLSKRAARPWNARTDTNRSICRTGNQLFISLYNPVVTPTLFPCCHGCLFTTSLALTQPSTLLNRTVLRSLDSHRLPIFQFKKETIPYPTSTTTGCLFYVALSLQGRTQRPRPRNWIVRRFIPRILIRQNLRLPVGYRDVKFITVWFQNRRQSDKRKAWTKKDRAKKKENSCQPIDIVPLKPTISLDRIASRMERVQRPVLPGNTPRAVLSPQKPRNVEEPQTPSRSKPNTLWAHMPSSPPEAPSSPPAELLNVPCLVKSGKSLEWACAKARVGSKHRLGKDKTRPAKRQTPTPRGLLLAAPEKELEVNTDDENQDVQTSTPSSSQGQHDVAPRTTPEPGAQPRSLDGKSTEDVEAAMVLLQFLQG